MLPVLGSPIDTTTMASAERTKEALKRAISLLIMNSEKVGGDDHLYEMWLEDSEILKAILAKMSAKTKHK